MLRSFIVALVSLVLVEVALAQPTAEGTTRSADLATLVPRMCKSLDELKAQITDPGEQRALAQDLDKTICKASALAMIEASRDYTLRELRALVTAQLAANVNVCEPPLTVRQHAAALPSFQLYMEVCGAQPQGGGMGIDRVAVLFVQGLGDYLKDAARQTLVDYAVRTVARQACTDDKKREFDLSNVLVSTCKLLFPNGVDEDADVDSLTLDSLRTPFVADMKALPDKLWKLIEKKYGSSEGFQVVTRVVGALAFVVVELANDKSPLEMLKDFHARVHEVAGHVRCNLADATTFGRECALLFLLETGVVAAEQYENTPRPIVEAWLDDAVVRFCETYGVDAVKADGKCIYGAPDVQKWKDRAKRLIAAFSKLGVAQAVLNRLVKLEQTTVITSAPDVAAAIDEIYAVLTEVMLEIDGSDTMKKVLAAGRLIVGAYTSVLAENGAGIRNAILDVLKSDLVLASLSESQKKAVGFIVSVASAEERGDVKAAIESVAAPVGTWKMKYGRGRTTVALNGFVGPRVGWQYRDTAASVTEKDPIRVVGLTSPVGLDITFPIWEDWHLGLGFTVLDPLAMEQFEEDGEETETDLESAVALGGYVRIGILRSPFALIGGVTWRPGLKSDELCGPTTERCFQGAWEVGAALAIDVPIFVIR